MRAGMDVVRLNFSHGMPEDHAATVALVRAASVRHQKPIAILADLQGPKIRTGHFRAQSPCYWLPGQRIHNIQVRENAGTTVASPSRYKRLASEVQRGDRILLADGLIELPVQVDNQQANRLHVW